MMALCLRYVRSRNDAVEVLNDAFLKIYKHLARWDPAKAALFTWMRTIVINTALDSLRRQKLIHEREMSAGEDEEPGVDNEAISKMSGDELLAIILRLPVATRLVFNLHSVEGYTHREIGQLLGISEGTSRWHLNDARRQLKLIIHLMESNK
jgi:RNA polymerase sigma factor (sigma-70 family)